MDVDKITWQDLHAAEDYPVWVLNFQEVSQPVDFIYSSEQSTEIVTEVINHLHSEFKQALLKQNESYNKKSPMSKHAVLINAYNSIDNLSILLRFVDTCFKYVPVERVGDLRYELTYDYGNDYEHKGVIGICDELKRSAKRQLDNSNEIDGSVYLNFYQKIVINSVEDELSYTGILRIFDKFCFIRFLWHSSSREIKIDISRHLPAEEIVNNYVHFQEAILDQLNRLSNEH